MTQDELKERLAKIETAEDFVRIFNEVRPHSMGSPGRCAGDLKNSVPLAKQNLAEEAITILRQKFPGTSWYYAGD